MNFIAKTLFAAVAAATTLAATADGTDESDNVNRAAKYNNDSALLAPLCGEYIDDAGDRSLTDFGMGILEGAAGLSGHDADDYSEEPPPNPLYPEPMEKDALYFGGSDWGRFIPESLILNDGIRPDVSLVTQNGLVDDKYLSSVRKRIGDKAAIPSNEDLSNAFAKFVEDVETGRIQNVAGLTRKDGRISIEGPASVMKLNEILAKKVFDDNKGRHAIYMEESYPMGWSYNYMSAHGLVVKLNPEKTGAPTEAEIRNDTEFWDWMTRRLLSDPEFAARRAERYRKDADGNNAPEHRTAPRYFAKLRLTFATMYVNRSKGTSANAIANAIRQAFAIDPQDTMTILRYAGLLKCIKNNAAAEDLVEYAKGIGFPYLSQLPEIVR